MGIQKSRCVGCFSEHTNMESAFQLGELSIKLSHYYLVSKKCAQENNITRKRLWRSGRVSESKSENVGSLPGGVAFEPSQLCRRSSTFVKFCRKSSIFIVKIFFRDIGNFFRHLCELVLRHQMRVSNYFVNSFYSVDMARLETSRFKKCCENCVLLYYPSTELKSAFNVY